MSRVKGFFHFHWNVHSLCMYVKETVNMCVCVHSSDKIFLPNARGVLRQKKNTLGRETKRRKQ